MCASKEHVSGALEVEELSPPPENLLHLFYRKTFYINSQKKDFRWIWLFYFFFFLMAFDLCLCLILSTHYKVGISLLSRQEKSRCYICTIL